MTEMATVYQRILKSKKVDDISKVIEIVSGYRSLCIYFEQQVDLTKIRPLLTELCAPENYLEKGTTAGRKWRIPVCYEPSFALDIEEVATHCSLTVQELIFLHTEVNYDVHFIGFMPGFPYLGGMDERLFCPRKSVPRLKIPAGSVGIAAAQTGIYPLSSPGGWQIIGNCPISIFDISSERPALFQAGDQISFYAINEEEYHRLKKHNTRFNPKDFLNDD